MLRATLKLNAASVIAQCGVPLILQSSGTVGANGALSGIVALPFAYAACYMYFVAGAVYAGSTAGWYYAVMSSTTAATVYNDRYTSGAPAIPATPTPIVAAGPGAYTQATGTITALSVTIPGGAMGPHGRLRVSQMGGCISNGGNKVVEAYFGGSVFASYTFTTSAGYRAQHDICNLAAATNIGNYYVGIGGLAVDWKRQSVNTAVDQVLTLTLKIAVAATDYASIESATVEVMHGA